MPEEPTRLRDLLGGAGRALGLSAPVETGRLWARWPEVVGEAISRHAQPTSLRRGVLRVRTDSPAWATEIGYLGEQIRGAANRALEADLVREVRVWTGPPERELEAPRGPPSGPPPPPEGRVPESDPMRALERARTAWAKRARGARRRPPQNWESRR
ncbi:MAG: DUF721 domain-containing protein [Actinomycetota bacterium]